MGIGGSWEGEEELVLLGVVSSWYEDGTADEGVAHDQIIKIVFYFFIIFLSSWYCNLESLIFSSSRINGPVDSPRPVPYYRQPPFHPPP